MVPERYFTGVPLPRINEFLDSLAGAANSDGSGRQLAERHLGFLEAYLEGQPPDRYDPSQAAWFGLFLDGRGLQMSEREQALATALAYRKFLGGDLPSGNVNEAPPKEVSDRFKPGPSTGPPPKPGWKKKLMAGKTAPAGGAGPAGPAGAKRSGTSLLAALLIPVAIIGAFYWGFIRVPLNDFEYDITQRLRANSAADNPTFGAWVQAEAARRGLDIIPEQSSSKLVSMHEYMMESEPVYAMDLRVGTRIHLPFGLSWTRILRIETETYVQPGDWPPAPPANAQPPQQRTVAPAPDHANIPRKPYEPVLSALEASRANAFKFYQDNPEEAEKLLRTEITKIGEMIDALPATELPEELIVRSDLKTSVDRLRSVANAINQFNRKLLDVKRLRQSVDTSLAQGEYYQRKADSQLYSEP